MWGHGEIGRRAGLKILWPQGRVGSIPTAPTTIRYLYRKLRRTCGEQCSFFDKQSRAGETSPI